jgi:stress-induced-phosphoprotein 1
MELPHALKDVEKCLEIDPNFVKGYVRKGACHHLMKEYHKALAAYEKGLKMDPENKDLIEGRMKTM